MESERQRAWDNMTTGAMTAAVCVSFENVGTQCTESDAANGADDSRAHPYLVHGCVIDHLESSCLPARFLELA